MSYPLAHSELILYHSEPSDVPYCLNQFLGWEFFCHFFLQENSSSVTAVSITQSKNCQKKIHQNVPVFQLQGGYRRHPQPQPLKNRKVCISLWLGSDRWGAPPVLPQMINQKRQIMIIAAATIIKRLLRMIKGRGLKTNLATPTIKLSQQQQVLQVPKE